MPGSPEEADARRGRKRRARTESEVQALREIRAVTQAYLRALEVPEQKGREEFERDFSEAAYVAVMRHRALLREPGERSRDRRDIDLEVARAAEAVIDTFQTYRAVLDVLRREGSQESKSRGIRPEEVRAAVETPRAAYIEALHEYIDTAQRSALAEGGQGRGIEPQPAELGQLRHLSTQTELEREHVEEPTQLWFAGKDVDTLLYRINRRTPVTGETLFTQPVDVLNHLEQVLAVSVSYETGRAHKRLWHIGNKIFDHRAGTLTGRVGWTRPTEVQAPVWDDERQEWADRVLAGDVTVVAPFAFDADRRYLGVMRHSSFSETTIAEVFREILNLGERRRPEPSTDWDVEPVGDAEEFYQWVASADRVVSVDLVFKRPNPDAEREFEQLFARQNELRARYIKESIAAQDNERGLSKQALRREPVTRSFIMAAMAAFGYIVGRGYRAGRKVTYDQRRRAARERIENVGPSWDGATEEVLGAVRRAEARRRQDG